MKTLRLLSILAALSVAPMTLASPALAFGDFYTLVGDPRGAVQLASFAVGNASAQTGDVVCVVYLGTHLFESDATVLVNLADQTFEEIVGQECTRYTSQNLDDKKWYAIPRCILYIGDIIISVADMAAFKQSLLRGKAEGINLRVEYHLKERLGSVEQQTDRALEYERKTQPDVPVGASVRAPNLKPMPREVATGVSVGFENMAEITYFRHNRPTLLIFYQTSIPRGDRARQRALAATVVSAFAAERLKRRELESVRINAFGEVRRSRFDFRSHYGYNTDDTGAMESDQ